MIFPVPSPPLSAYTDLVVIAILLGLCPLLGVRKAGWAKSLKRSLLVSLALLPIVAAAAYTVTANRVELDGGRLYIQASLFYELHRHLDDFDLERARTGSRREIPEASLRWRQNGVSTPGYRAGRFTLAKGGLAFVMVSDDDRVLFLPAKAGPSVLVSVEDPQALLQAMREQLTQHDESRKRPSRLSTPIR